MANATLRKLSEIQKKLYESTVFEARSLAFGLSKEVQRYAKGFEESLPREAHATTLRSLHASIGRQQIILFGDFHTHKQCQKEFIRVVERYLVRESDASSPVLALEAFRRSDQASLDAFQSGRLNEEAFLKAIDYEESWGFPWENYRRILDFARERDLKVLAVNAPRSGKDAFNGRDHAMADCLATQLARTPNKRIFCLVGEFHLAPDALPAALSSRGVETCTRIVMNVDRYFFGDGPAEKLNRTKYLRLDTDAFCIINATPWLKWQSYTIWEEMRQAQKPRLKEASFEGAELGYDIDSHFYTLLKVLTGYFELSFSESELTDFHIDAWDDALRLHPRLTHDLSGAAGKQLRQKLSYKGYSWTEDSHSMILRRLNTNVLAEAGGEFIAGLLRSKVPRAKLDSDSKLKSRAEDFCDEVLLASFAALCSKVINPQRKLKSYRSLIAMKLKSARSPSISSADGEVDGDAVRTHLQALAGVYPKNSDDLHPLIELLGKQGNEDRDSLGKRSHRLGQHWGDFLFRKHLDGKLSLSFLRSIFTPRVADRSDAIQRYLDLSAHFFSAAPGLRAIAEKKSPATKKRA